MSKTGSLIQLHHHNNFEILEQLTEKNNILHYKDVPIFPSVSDEEIQQAITDTLKILKEKRV